MPELRIVRAGQHALTLLSDIHDNALRELSEDLILFGADDYNGLHDHATECSVHYFIGFEDHRPFGYVRISIDEGECEITGPYVYPDYLRGDFQAALIEFAVDYMQNLKVRLVYALVLIAISGIAEAYTNTHFEDLSDDPQFIKRWHDGVLAHRVIPSGTQLFARILESSSKPIDSE